MVDQLSKPAPSELTELHGTLTTLVNDFSNLTNRVEEHLVRLGRHPNPKASESGAVVAPLSPKIDLDSIHYQVKKGFEISATLRAFVEALEKLH